MNRMIVVLGICAAIGIVFLPNAASAQSISVPNASFEEGMEQPARWTLAGNEGSRANEGQDGTHSICVKGTGATENTSSWSSDPLAFEPNAVYRLRFFARTEGPSSGGTPTSGPVFCNRDLGTIPNTWTEFISIFVSPDKLTPEASRLRFGQWERADTVFFDNVEVVRAEPIYLTREGFTLGEGEQVDGNAYVFKAPYTGESRNQSRPLVSHCGTFNTLRWVFPGTTEVVYRHQVARTQTEASVEVGLCLYSGGELIVECGTDGQTWQEIGAIHAIGAKTMPLPKTLFPAEALWVRMRPRPDAELPAGVVPGSLQVDAYGYRATLDGAPAHLLGATRFVAVRASTPGLSVQLDNFGDCIPGGNNTLEATLTNLSGKAIPTRPTLTFVSSAGRTEKHSVAATINPGRQTIRVPYRAPNAGTFTARFTLGDEKAYMAEATIRVPDLYESSYGYQLPGSSDDLGLWWCRSGWRVSQTRPVPDATSEGVEIRLAANEADAAQVVLRPSQDLKGLHVQTAALKGPDGAEIPADRVEVLRVRYVNVKQPTDAVGAVAPWPDPLPPFSGPIDVAAGQNQPLWVRVTVPASTAPGAYAGHFVLEAGTVHVEVPLYVTVFGFALPDRMTCTSAFGFSPGRVFAYQKLTTPEDQRAVLEKYWASFAAHHISPYDPAPLDPFAVTWPALGDWTGTGVRDRAEKSAGESALLLDDASSGANVQYAYAKTLAIPAKGFHLRFAYKTRNPGQPFSVTFSHLDAAGNWMPNRNNDIAIQGDGTWQAFDRVITEFPQGAQTARFTLRPAPWAEDGSTTGAVWFDNVSIQDGETGQELVSGGDFEPIDPQLFTPAFDWTAWDAAVTHAMDTYHFNGIKVPIEGMGGGTFHERWEPTLLGYGESTPEYKAAFRNYCQGLQEHLREKGLLPYSYVYWFDEPEPRDYAFVMNGFLRLKDAAPDIRRMLTEQVETALVGGPNIWCPLTPAYTMETADARRAEGDHFWWYVCCGPKEPYCTLFLDHPAVELRTWLWQTWQRKVEGILVWETNYWNSTPAYPDPEHPQNPYEDTMSWTEGYSTPIGTRIPWGNGDGRFIYPPEAAADGRPEQPVLDGPVDSIRWEMLRDGIEDYEYHVILRRLIDERGAQLPADQLAACKALLEVPTDITAGITTFAREPEPIERQRELIARAIEQLSKQ